MLSATALSHKFDYKLFDNLNINAYGGDTISIVGVSGSGKSTLIHILSTMIKPFGGSVEILGKNIYALKDSDIFEIRRKHIGIIFQSHYLFRGFSAIENIKIASMLSGIDIDMDIVESLNIKDIINHNIGELSGGQQQRVSIARALIKKPKIIFADEPTGSLDKETAKNVIDMIFEYVKKTNAILFLVTHDNYISSMCSRKYILSNGEFKEY